MGETGSHKVVFLDRDGVINQDSPQYIKSWSEFEFLPGSIEALAALNRSGFEVIVITNQSAVNRGLISKALLEQMHDRLKAAVQSSGGRILDVFYCPHLPEEGCGCRKPKPGLIERACRKYGLNPETTTMVGDSAKDIKCARNAGCRRAALVRTGNGKAAHRELKAEGVPVDFVAEDLGDAAAWIIRCGTD
ncbi:MAG: histidinol phosphate phosphatase [Deltaproteobacteria bacterium SG8_13]|nr:MAG: histidinol phosphate phosphatase [Deltaproteobacteria bacterium SG8_13]